jgi:hypothetical protein
MDYGLDEVDDLARTQASKRWNSRELELARAYPPVRAEVRSRFVVI